MKWEFFCPAWRPALWLLLAGLWFAQPSEGLGDTGYTSRHATNWFALDGSQTFQTIDNFGANDAWSMQKVGAWSETNKNRIADLLFSTNAGIGLSCWRFNLGAGLNDQTIKNDWRTVETFETAPGQYDWSRQANARWFLRAAKAHGVQQFLATVYSPPQRLTRNGLSNLGADKTNTTNLKPGAEADFAGYLTDILAHFRTNTDPAEAITFNYLLPVNEPQWDWQSYQEGNRACNADLRRIFLAVHRQLLAAGLPTQILGPESGSLPDMSALDAPAREKWQADYGDYFHLLADNSALAGCFNHLLSYHSYWSDGMPDHLVSDRAVLGRTLAAHPGWKLWQSEYCVMEWHRDLTMATALRVARIIHCDLTLVGASAWQWWEAVSNEDFKSGLIYTDYAQPGDPETIYESKTLWALGNYSRFIRPGMRRMALTGSEPNYVRGPLASAYLDPQSGRVVVVMINLRDEPVAVGLTGRLPAGASRRFIPYTTSAAENLLPGAPVTAGEPFLLPPQSVTTLVSQP